MVDDRNLQLLLGPGHGRRIGALAGQEQRAELRQVMSADQVALRVLALDRAERGRRGEKDAHLMLFDDPPERAGIRRTDRLALVHDRSTAVDQRPVDDIRMPDDPADIRGGPENLVRRYAVDVRHRPGKRDGVPAIVAHDAFRNAGRARGIENVERIGRQDRHAIGRAGARFQLLPVMVAARHEFGPAHRPLQDDAGFRLRARLGDRRVEQGLVRDDPVDLDAARGRQHHARPRVVDAGRQFVRREPAEHDRMHRADPGTGQHRDRRLRDHRHIDQHAVALPHPEPGQHPGDKRGPVAHLAIGKTLDRAGDRAVPDQRDPVAASRHDMAVERVPARVETRADEPSVKRRIAFVEDPVPAPLPIDCLGRLGPEFLRSFQRAAIGLGIERHRVLLGPARFSADPAAMPSHSPGARVALAGRKRECRRRSMADYAMMSGSSSLSIFEI